LAFARVPREATQLNFGYAVGYHYRPCAHHQFGITAHSDFREDATRVINLGVRIGHLYNFSDDLARSFFGGIAVGAGLSQFGDDDDVGVFGEVLFRAGQRFAIDDALVYEPSVYLQLRTDSSVGYGINALSLGWFF
jgi:hypothetical protein